MKNETFKKIDDIKKYVEDGLASGILTPAKYVKSATVTAKRGEIGEKVTTVIADGLVETVNVVTADEETGKAAWIVTNPSGEKYIVNDSVFCRKYEKVEGTDDLFKPKGAPVTAVRIDEAISFCAPWGEDMSIKSGGYLVISDMNDIYGIQPKEFGETYKPVPAE